jgi:regulator of sirC expression with transglutaminase-like and TPR domain
MGEAIQQLGLLEDEAIPLDEAALMLAALDHEEVDVDPYLSQIAGMAAELAGAMPRAPRAHDRAERLADLLHRRHGFRGDAADYDNPANADLIAVIDRRRGLPVALSIIYVTVARRVGWTAEPLNMPGHVLVRIGRETDSVIIDPFDRGVVLDSAGLARLVGRVVGSHATVEPEHLEALGNRAVLVRLLSNQAARARRGGDLERALALHERMTSIAPSFTGLWWERARLEQLLGRARTARASLGAMLETTRDPALRSRIRAALDALARSIN